MYRPVRRRTLGVAAAIAIAVGAIAPSSSSASQASAGAPFVTSSAKALAKANQTPIRVNGPAQQGTIHETDAEPLKLVPDPIAIAPPGHVTPSVVVGGSYTCSDLGTFRADSGSFVIGSCLVGVHVKVQSINEGWARVFGEGNFDHCGWIETAAIGAPGGAFTSCSFGTSDQHMPMHEYAVLWNGDPNAGTGVAVRAGGCPFYRNVKPWTTSSTAYDQDGTIPAGTTFAYRYTSLNGFALGRDTRYNSGHWGFVPNYCVDPPPTYYGPRD